MNNWWTHAQFYHLYPLGFCKDGTKLIDFVHWIPHLKRMNINAVYLGPVFESTNHGYDTKDYFEIDQRLGTKDEFKYLCSKLHEHDIKIVLDGVFHHTGRHFRAFRDIQKTGESSQYKDWYTGIDFNSKSPEGDNFNYAPWEGHYSLPKLNLHNQDVKKHLFNAVKRWIDEFHIDGLRLDVAYALEMDFIQELRTITRNAKEDFFLLGEAIHGDYNNWLGKDKLDSVTSYQIYKGIFSSHNDKNLFEIEYELTRQFGYQGVYKDSFLYNFLDNHDVNRISSTLQDSHWIHTALILLYTIPGIPSIYYGSEFGLKGKRDEWSDAMLRPSASDIHSSEKDLSIEETIQKLALIRSQSKALQEGHYKTLHISSELLVFERSVQNERAIVVVNISDADTELPENINIAHMNDILNPGLNNKTIPKYWGRIWA